MGESVEEGSQLAGVEDAAWLRVMELGSLCCVPMALKAALQLNVMAILSQHGPMQLSAADIVSHMHTTPTSNPRAHIALDRILRLLASYGVLSSSLEPSRPRHVRTYGLNQVSQYLVKNEDGASLVPICLLNLDTVFMDTWHYLHEAVLDGSEPFTKAHGKDAFSYGQDDLRFGKLFNSAMANHTKLFIPSFLDIYSGFDNISTLVDVGGGLGSCVSMIISKHPHMKGINFDQPHVVASAPEYPGVKSVGGDMFESIPQGDAIFMKWILHDWSDEHCVKILKNCFKSLPKEGGKVIVLDTLLSEAVKSGTRSRLGYHADVQMLAYHQGGRERTHQELLSISKLGEFERLKVVSKLNECSIIELYKD